MKRVKTKLDYRQMPPEDALRVGIKVSWRYYRDEKVAREAAVIASHNGKIDAAQGYDFGYQVPGSLTFVKEGERAGLWEVCES
jgi:hypothetical protein